MIDNRITFDERHVSDVYGTTTLYFIAPKELLNNKYPEAESTEISIEFPTNNQDPEYASVMFSPTKDGEDYDWYDVNLPHEDIEQLMALSK